MFLERFSYLAEKMTPDYYKKLIKNSLVYADIKMGVGSYLIMNFIIAIITSLLSIFILKSILNLQGNIVWLPFPIFLGSYMLVNHNIMIYLGQRRARQIEEMLPDALQLVAANIRADIPIHKALILAARPEFGLLTSQLRRIGDEILTGGSIDRAFDNFSRRVDSPLVKRVSTLMEESLKSGHDLAGLLEQVAYDIRVFKVLEGEAAANVGSYVIFIIMAVIIIAPVLYSVSISFVDLSVQVKSKLGVEEFARAGIPATRGASLTRWVLAGEVLPVRTLIIFAGANLFLSAIIATMVVSILQTGESLQRLPYVPLFIATAIILFFGSLSVLRSVLLGMFA